MASESPPPPTDTPGLRANRACRHCVQIKARCVPTDTNNNCVRCQRLGKTCTTPAPISRKRRVNPTRVSRLEQRINTLTDLLASKGATTIAPDYVATLKSSGPTTVADQVAPQEIVTGFPNGLWSASIVTPSTPTTAPDASTTPDVQHESTVVQAAECGRFGNLAGTPGDNDRFRVVLTPSLEEQLFNNFRTQLSQHYPFVVIPPYATTTETRGSKPFLFRCCLTAACHTDPYLAQRLSEDLIRYYCSFNPQMINPQVMNLLHLATAESGQADTASGILQMATDLGLNRPNQPAVLAPIGAIIDTAQMIHGKLVNQGIQTSDDRRALLGVYCLSGQFSSCFRRLDPMRWTKHLEDCCTTLLTAAEYPSDSFAVYQVRLHRAMETYSPYLGLLKTSTVPLRTYMTCIQQDLGRFQASLPAILAEDAYMKMQLHHAYICLYETIFLVEGDSAFHKAEALHDCLNHIADFWDALDIVPSHCLPNLTFVFWLHVIHVVIIVAKLSFVVIDGWDVQSIRSSKVNFPSVTDRFTAKLKAVSEEGPGAGPAPASHPAAVRFTRYVDKMALCKKWYESKIMLEVDGAGIIPENGLQYDFSMAGLFEGLEDDFWTNWTGDWNTHMPF